MHSREEKDYVGATLISLELVPNIYKYFKYTTACFFFKWLNDMYVEGGMCELQYTI